MNNELIKELSRLQLLSGRCKNKMSMCPLSITSEENRAYLIFNYIKELQQENQKYKEVINKAIEYTEEHRINNPYHHEYNCFMGTARVSDLLEILKEDK